MNKDIIYFKLNKKKIPQDVCINKILESFLNVAMNLTSIRNNIINDSRINVIDKVLVEYNTEKIGLLYLLCLEINNILLEGVKK